MEVPKIVCKTCAGTGRITVKGNKNLWHSLTCFECDGTGKVIDKVLHGALLRLDSAIKKRNYLNLLIKEGT